MFLRARFALPCVAALVAAPLTATADPLFTVTFLPEALSGSAINNAGQIAGVMPVPEGSHAFLYTNGDVRDLGTLGGTRSVAYGLNDRGMVTGDASPPSGPGHAFVHANGTMRDLGTLPGGSSSIGLAINNDEQVTGSAATGAGQTHAMLTDQGGMRDLGTLGGNFSYGSDINDAGHVVGASSLAGNEDGRHAFFYRDGVMTDLGDLGGIRSVAERINDRDQILGAIVDASEVAHSFIYAQGALTMLGDFGGRYTGNWDINNLGQVVGYSTYTDAIDSRHGFLYTDGRMLDINALIDPALGWTVATAIGINDAQQILGYACRSADVCRPVRLDPITPPPIPEPGRQAMWLAGLAACAIGRRRRSGAAP